MNKGIELSKGRYIGMLNSGDKYTENGLNISKIKFVKSALRIYQ